MRWNGVGWGGLLVELLRRLPNEISQAGLAAGFKEYSGDFSRQGVTQC